MNIYEYIHLVTTCSLSFTTYTGTYIYILLFRNERIYRLQIFISKSTSDVCVVLERCYIFHYKKIV